MMFERSISAMAIMVMILITGASACAPVSPSIDRRNPNAGKTAKDPLESPKEEKQTLPIVKTLNIQSEVLTKVIARDQMDDQLKSWQENKLRNKEDLPPTIVRLAGDDPRLQKLMNEPITLNTGALQAKKVIFYVGVTPPKSDQKIELVVETTSDKKLKDSPKDSEDEKDKDKLKDAKDLDLVKMNLDQTKLSSFAVTQEKELGTVWTLQLSREMSEEQKKSLAKEINDFAMVIFPFENKELVHALEQSQKVITLGLLPPTPPRQGFGKL